MKKRSLKHSRAAQTLLLFGLTAVAAFAQSGDLSAATAPIHDSGRQRSQAGVGSSSSRMRGRDRVWRRNARSEQAEGFGDDRGRNCRRDHRRRVLALGRHNVRRDRSNSDDFVLSGKPPWFPKNANWNRWTGRSTLKRHFSGCRGGRSSASSLWLSDCFLCRFLAARWARLCLRPPLCFSGGGSVRTIRKSPTFSFTIYFFPTNSTQANDETIRISSERDEAFQ